MSTLGALPGFFRHRPLAWYTRQFADLAPPTLADLIGRFRAEFVGPGWLRMLAPPGLALIGLRDWWGKDFASPAALTGELRGVNLCRRGADLASALPMVARVAPSLVDGRPGVTIGYPPKAPFPWPWMVDEVRRLDDAAFLCLTVTTPRRLPRLPLPFLLHRER